MPGLHGQTGPSWFQLDFKEDKWGQIKLTISNLIDLQQSEFRGQYQHTNHFVTLFALTEHYLQLQLPLLLQ